MGYRFHVLLTSYEMLRTDRVELRKVKFEVRESCVGWRESGGVMMMIAC